MEYMIEFNGIYGLEIEWWTYDDYEKMIAEVCNELRNLDCEYADIYNEDGAFVDTVKIF